MDNWEHFCVLLQIHESRGHTLFEAAEWLHFGEDAPTEEGPLSSVAVATSTPPSSSGAFSEDAPTEESMELDYADNSVLATLVQPAMTPQVVLSPIEAVVVTNITASTTPEAGSSGSSDMADTVLECWVDIMRNEEAGALKMDEQAG
ncbi:hypothetical protein C0989_006675 [Termitomyces sp. Mn162]|nr:hypothetical protein C0989_006675 [Termitomyces sp. Mn162]